MTEQHHKTIWLAPWCDECERQTYCAPDGRTWCKDDVYEPCEECGRKPVKYTVVKK